MPVLTVEYKTITLPRKLFIAFFVLFFFNNAEAQNDSVSKDPVYDTSVDYDELFNELDSFLDSLLAPRTYAVLSIGAGTNFFDYNSNGDLDLDTRRQLIFSPSFGYYHRSGFGASASAAIINQKQQGLTPYQYVTTLSYDYLKNMNFITGVSATHYFTKDSLNFYTSPLKNELYGYFTYRKSWLKPSIAASYGWGSTESYEEREEYIKIKRLRRNGFTRINTQESVADFNLMVSVRHDFYWLDVFSKKDYFRLSPQINFTSGTQSFGFNQTTTTTYNTLGIIRKNEWQNSENTQLDDRLDFQPLSVAAMIKSEFAIGKFFIQPLFLVNYYFPAPEKNVSTAFTLNTGLIF